MGLIVPEQVHTSFSVDMFSFAFNCVHDGKNYRCQLGLPTGDVFIWLAAGPPDSATFLAIPHCGQEGVNWVRPSTAWNQLMLVLLAKAGIKLT